MQVTEKLAEGLKREYAVVISAAELEEHISERLAEVGKTVRVPGFRPGKVPVTILKQRFGQAVLGEVLEKSVNESSQEVITERELKPALQPKIEITSFEEGKDLEYSMEMEVLPEISPMDFTTIEIERMAVEVPEAEVTEALENLAKQSKSTKALKRARKSRKDDVVVIDFKGTVNGETHPGMESDDYQLELGSGSFIPGFEDQLIGKSKGEEVEVNVTFPEGYANEKLSGQDAVFKVTIKDILETEAAAIDDELAKKFGAESLEDLTEKVKGNLRDQYTQLARTKLKRDLLDKLADGHGFEVPASMVDMEFDTIWQQVEADRKAGNLDAADAEKDEDTLKAEFRDIATRRVRLGLLLSEVGQRNSIEVGQDEINRAVISEVQRYPGQEQQIFEFYQKNPQAIAQIRGPIFEDKVIDFVIDLAQVSEKAVSPEELRSALNEGEEEAKTEEKPRKKAAPKKAAAAKKSTAKKAPAKKTAAKDKAEDEKGS